jgi:uncharacterized protein (DUF305 family)
MNKRTLALVAAVPVTILTLTACGGSNTTSTDSSPGSSKSMPMPAHSTSNATMHNPADVAFAQSMIPHHKQAVEMAKLATTRASDPRVKDLAGRIEAAQDPEVMKMTGWLDTWGAAMPEDMAGMDGMPGMMSTADMDALAAAKGAAFDKKFLTMMIAHHNGALTMAKAERSGSAPDAKTLARAIIDGQTTEINEMKALLGSG